MKSCSIALILLVVYMVFVFITFRLIDLVVWWQYGISSTQIVDPILLSVKQLKQLLDVRGVKYTGLVEKKELAELAEESGDVSVGEVEELGESKGSGAAEFSGAPHLYEQVEDTKDSAWLVQVGGQAGGKPLLDDLNWHLVRHHLAPFSIRTGIFDCSLDPRLCASKGWHEPLLLLALPRGTKPKDTVFMRTSKHTRPQAIIEWLREELSSQVKQVSSMKEAEENWLSTSGGNSSVLGVKVLLLTHLLNPPLFLAALSIKFAGRISFGMVTMKKGEAVGKTNKVPAYMIITPERTVIYGKRKMEHFNLQSMNSFLKAVQPEMNDVFLCSLVLVNMFAALLCFQVEKECWWRIVALTLLKVVICNLFLFVVWLIMLWACRWSLVTRAGDVAASISRWVTLSDPGALVRSDWLRLTNHPWTFVSSLFIFAYVSIKSLRKFYVPSVDEGGRGWWDWLFRSPRDHQPVTNERIETLVIDLGDGLDMILEHLAVPNFWLRPEMIPTEYIDRLPVFKYVKDKTIKKDSPEAVEAMMDTADDKLLSRISQCTSDISCNSEDVSPLQMTAECSICLDKYRSNTLVCALPCSHCFHHKCIVTWLEQDNHHCPLCRWPAYKQKLHRKTN